MRYAELKDFIARRMRMSHIYLSGRKLIYIKLLAMVYDNPFGVLSTAGRGASN
jgi:hypothetical protein